MLPWRPGQILPQGSTIFGKEAPGEVGLPGTAEGSLLERGVLDCSGQAAHCPPSCSQGPEVGRMRVSLIHTDPPSPSSSPNSPFHTYSCFLVLWAPLHTAPVSATVGAKDLIPTLSDLLSLPNIQELVV